MQTPANEFHAAAQQPGTPSPAHAPNALTREVTSVAATTPIVVPPQLEKTAFESLLRDFMDYFQPVGPLETLMVRDLARLAAANEVWFAGVPALQRQRARKMPELLGLLGGDGDEEQDSLLAAAVSAPDVQKGEQLAQRNTRTFYQIVRELQQLQAQRKERAQESKHRLPTSPFRTEAACEEHLRKRFERGCYACPRCGCRHGHYLASRRCWECANCKRQIGLRTGTVAADSPLPLVVWLEAIRLLLWRPSLSTKKLAIRLGIDRAATVRNISRRIIAAMAEPNASELLAGLDICYARQQMQAPESGVPHDGMGEERHTSLAMAHT